MLATRSVKRFPSRVSYCLDTSRGTSHLTGTLSGYTTHLFWSGGTNCVGGTHPDVHVVWVPPAWRAKLPIRVSVLLGVTIP